MFKRIFWALFGNDDDGIYGDLAWNPSQSKDISYAIGWWVRNPFHNLTFYVIGLSTNPKTEIVYDFKRYGRYPKDVFAPSGGWNWCVIKYKWLWLPFISYQGWLGKFYIGWRERGNWGIKLTGKLLVIALVLLAIKFYPNLKSLMNF